MYSLFLEFLETCKIDLFLSCGFGETTVKFSFAGNPNLSSENIPATLTNGIATKKHTF